MKPLIMAARGVARTRAFFLRHPRVVAPFAWIWRHWWLALFTAAMVLIVRQPNRATLDMGSIFALAGLAIIVLSLTFPVILLIVQNLSQRAMKDLLDEFKRQALWKEPMATQAAAIVLIVAGGLWHATVSTGAAALVLLIALFAEGYGAFQRLLDQMSPVALTNHLVDRRIAELRRYRSLGAFGLDTGDRKAAQALESLFDMSEAAITTSDIELLHLTLDRANDVCLAYLDVSFAMGYGDPVSDPLVVRLDSLLKAAARSSTSVLLPEVTKRVAAIGATVAGYRRQGFLNPGHVPYSIINLLAEALAHGLADDRSSAPSQAIRGITNIGTAYIRARRIAATQRPIRELHRVVQAATRTTDQFLLHQVGTALVEIAYALSGVPVGDPMLPDCLERVTHALKELADADANGPVPGAATFIVNPIESHGFNLAAVTVRVMKQALAVDKRYRRDEFTRLARTLFKISHSLAASKTADLQTRDNATRVLTAIVLAAIGEHLQDTLPELFEEWWRAALDLLIENEHARTSLDDLDYYVAELLLTVFYARLESQEESTRVLQRLLEAALAKVASQPEKARRMLSPVIRLLGAAAMKNNILDLGRACAHVVLEPPSAMRQFRQYDVWFYAPHGDAEFMPWPARMVSGVDFLPLRADHNDGVARRQFLELEGPDIDHRAETLSWQYGPQDPSAAPSSRE